MFQVEVTARAQADADEAHAWMTEHISRAHADEWYRELFHQIETLKRHPTRCAIAAESGKFTQEIRELVYGKGRHKQKYRILFASHENVVTVLYIYHSSRKELEP